MGPRADATTRASDARYLDAIADAETYPYWLDDADEPESNPTIVRDTKADLCVVGGGYTGLWCAIGAKLRNPSRDVVLIDAHEVGSGASGRNGGFMDSSVTHGIANAQRRFPDEVNVLERLGLDNFTSIVDFIDRHRIDCDCERTGIIEVASTWHTPTYAEELREDYEQLAALGHDVVWLDRDAMREEIHSPVFTAGLWGRDSGALLDPARLAWGLKRVAEQLGVRIHEDTRATGLARDGAGMAVRTPLATIRAHRVALGTNTWKPLVRGAGSYVIPVYDYCLTTEPLTPQQLAGLGWRRRQGLSDVSNQFHYYRLTADNRVLWGGYDAIYHYGGRTDRELESRPETWARLARQFFETFPQLEGVRFSHMWGAPIDTCSRFSVFWDTAASGRVAYAMGYTGLGVASSRFGAEVMLDLLDGVDSPATRTRFVRTKPRRWPPEPVRWLAIQQTRRSLDREDRTGRRNWWLRLLDRLGLGFDS